MKFALKTQPRRVPEAEVLEAPAPGAASTSDGAKRLEAKHPLAIRWFHWINFPVLFIMIWSGLLIYWANDVFRVGWASSTLFHFFPQKFYEKFGLGSRLAEGMAWHFTLGWAKRFRSCCTT